jgi:uncharacterized membrane protein
MVLLTVASVSFVLIHILVSGTRLRDRLVATLGEGPYMGLYSLVSLGTLVLAISAYQDAQLQSTLLYVPPRWLADLSPVLLLPAFMLVVIGLTTPSPTAAKMEFVLERDEAAVGILRITRHPFLMGVLLWAVVHAALNPDPASWIFFLSLAVVCVAGPPSIDAKRRRRHGARWQRFEDQTSIIPFAAIAAGRNRWIPSELGWVRVGASVAVYSVLLFAHRWLFGVPAAAWLP